MTGDNTDDGMMLSRRDAIRGGAALGTMALASRIGAYAQVVEAQITEPRIQLGSDYAIHDDGGNLVINHDPNGDIIYYDATADQITTLKPLTSVTTEDLAATNQSSAFATLSSSQNTTSGSAFELIEFDAVDHDNKGEFDTVNHEFVADASGMYIITLLVSYSVGASGDDLTARLERNGNEIMTQRLQAGGSNFHNLNVTTVDKLTAGDVITGLARNLNNNDTLTTGTSIAIHRVA